MGIMKSGKHAFVMHIAVFAANKCAPDGKRPRGYFAGSTATKHNSAGPDASDLGNGERLARQPLGPAILHLKEASFIPRKKNLLCASHRAAVQTARRPETITDYSGRANVITELVLSILLKR